MPDRYGDPLEGDEPLASVHHLDEPADAKVRAMAVVNCGLCDDDGYRNLRVCDHVDHSDTNARGMAAVRAALERGGA